MSSDTTAWKTKTIVQLAPGQGTFCVVPWVCVCLTRSFFLSILPSRGHPGSQFWLRVPGLSALSAGPIIQCGLC